MIVNTTKSYCCECGSLHDAVVRAEGKKVYFDVLCPAGTKSMAISHDADAFLKIRRKSSVDFADEQGRRGISWLNILEITDDCNFTCPVCFAGSGEGNGRYLSAEEIIEIAVKLRKQGIKAVSLSGGEPTLHPELFDIIKGIRKAGLDVTILTNAVIIGEDRTMARRMKKSGLIYSYFQFDTLREDVHRKIRGNDRIGDKIRAMDHAREAGIYFGIIMTVIKDNLAETGSVLQHAAGYIPNCAIVTYLAASKAGRFELDVSDLVDREEIINSIIGSGEIGQVSTDNFWPFPRFAPLGLDIHPDCAALLYLAVNNGVMEPLENYLDIGRLYRLMGKSRGRVNRLRGFVLFSIYFVRSLKLGKIIPLYRMLLGLYLKKGRRSVMIVAVEQFMSEQYQDQQRIDHCTTCNVLKSGVLVPACIFQHPDRRRYPLTRENMKGNIIDR